jgi:hypothetical protein
VLAASIIGTMIMEAANTSETSANFYQIHGATTQKTVIRWATGDEQHLILTHRADKVHPISTSF